MMNTFVIYTCVTGGSTHIVLTVDPDSGKSVEQFLQTKVDPISGKTSQILLPISSGNVDSQHGESNISFKLDSIDLHEYQNLLFRQWSTSNL